MGETENLHPLGLLQIERWCFRLEFDFGFALHDLWVPTGGSNSQTEREAWDQCLANLVTLQTLQPLAFW